MEPVAARLLKIGFLALLLLAPLPDVVSEPKVLEPGRGEGDALALRAAVSLGTQGSLSSTIRLEGGLGTSVLTLVIDGEGAVIRGALSCGPFLCGPGRLSGAAGFFSSPVSFAATPLGGESLKIDAGLASGLSLLALDLGAATVFALSRNGSKGFIARAPGLAAGEAAHEDAGFSLEPEPVAGEARCATGLVARRGAAWGNLAFLAAASRAGPPLPGDGWRLDAAPDPGGLGLVAGLAYEARGKDWRSAFGFGYSWGPLRGGGSSARFESSVLLPPLRLSLKAGYAAGDFRDCLGEGEDRGAALALDLGFPLWSGSSFRAACRLECPSFGTSRPRGGALCELIGRSASLSLSARAGGTKSGAGALRLGLGLSFGIDGEGSAFLAPDLGLSGKTGAAAWKLGLSGRWVQAPGEMEASPALKAMFRASTPASAPFSLSAGYGVSWEPNRGPSLDAGLGLSFAVFGEGRLSVDAEWRDLGLGILGAGEAAPAPVFGFRYSLAL